MNPAIARPRRRVPRRRLYHSHWIEMTRARLGRARADRLLVDAARGGNLRTPLARAMGCRIVSYVDEGDFLLVMSDPLGWSGDRLDLGCTVPETLASLLPGMRLGDVVSGTGSDDAIIAAVERQGPAIVNASGRMTNPVEFPERDVLRIECELVDVRSIRLPLADRLLGPPRRTWGRCAWTWYEVFIKELGTNVQSVNDLVFMTSMATMCLAAPLLLAWVMAMRLVKGMDQDAQNLMVVLAMAVPFLWMGTGMLTTTIMGLRNRRAQRTG
jgi:hypothetical protein